MRRTKAVERVEVRAGGPLKARQRLVVELHLLDRLERGLVEVVVRGVQRHRVADELHGVVRQAWRDSAARVSGPAREQRHWVVGVGGGSRGVRTKVLIDFHHGKAGEVQAVVGGRVRLLVVLRKGEELGDAALLEHTQQRRFERLVV